LELANSLLNLDPEKSLPQDFKLKFNILVTMAAHPKYEKFYKMLKVGINKEIAQAKMRESGVDPSMLDKEPETVIPLGPTLVAISKHRKYAKYFKMLALGLKKEPIQAKMQLEGIDPNMLDKNPKELIPWQNS
jgi:hypothetical protein